MEKQPTKRRYTEETAASLADSHRLELSPSLAEQTRKKLGQFMTPKPIAEQIASLFGSLPEQVRLLDAGAGMGALTAAFVGAACRQRKRPLSIDVTCFEVDPGLVGSLSETLERCKSECLAAGIGFQFEIVRDDYIMQSAEPLLAKRNTFNCAILNPPYGKINTASKWRAALRTLGIETVNLYAAFVALALRQLENNGQLVAITPRSFCNGSYYEPFRHLVLDSSAIEAIHVFESRKTAFKDDDVLQENIIFRLRKKGRQNSVALSTDLIAPRMVPFTEVVRPSDRHAFIRVPVNESPQSDNIRALPCTLKELGVTVSTGRVVDFRATQFLRREPSSDTVPLIYPGHFEDGAIRWPIPNFRKCNALADCAETASLIVPGGTYVLTKRFTSKEERRRLVASIYEGSRVGFENHLNYFHIRGEGLPQKFALGLAKFLNTEIVDQYFRTFSGHTQVNATDLRNLHFPTWAQIERLGEVEDANGELAKFF